MKIGDRVKVIENYDCAKQGIGTLKHKSSANWAVEFDKEMDGHSCDGRCKNNHGQWIPEKYLKLIKQNERGGKIMKRNEKTYIVFKTDCKNYQTTLSDKTQEEAIDYFTTNYTGGGYELHEISKDSLVADSKLQVKIYKKTKAKKKGRKKRK